jgi:hypothetical protein
MNYTKLYNYMSDQHGLILLEEEMQEIVNICNEQQKEAWISTEIRPLFTKDEHGNWICTEDGDNEFIAAVPYSDSKKPDKDLWWIRHCVIEDESGLCVVGDCGNEPASWSVADVTHWQPMPSPPTFNGGSVCLTENEILKLANIGSQYIYTGANDVNYLSHGGVLAILKRYEELRKIER